MNSIDLVPIGALNSKRFLIPSYQRGYRWTEQEVVDLLDDVLEFHNRGQKGIYCIQPLVVGTTTESSQTGCWDVIDGQQRLTTIYIILKYLGVQLYTISYQTRKGSREFLESLGEQSTMNDSNIDFFYMSGAYKCVESWFEGGKCTISREKFLELLLEKVCFIWYQTAEKDNIEIFTRLNIGKISLTNSELIKALFLNKGNFDRVANHEQLTLHQTKIAVEWEQMERELQCDEFWAFFNKGSYRPDTRIDFIFELICALDGKYFAERHSYATFRHFYRLFKWDCNIDLMQVVTATWQRIVSLFNILQEWYNSAECYHYIGFLVESDVERNSVACVAEYIKLWQSEGMDKAKFVDELCCKIATLLKSRKCDNLDRQYTIQNKREAMPLLLLHNVESVVAQIREQQISQIGQQSLFYRFPFHLYKSQTEYGGWDVEHIASSVANDLSSNADKIEYLVATLIYLECECEGRYAELTASVKGALQQLRTEPKGFRGEDFEAVRTQVAEQLGVKEISEGQDDAGNIVDKKNMVWNYALLDSATNRGYGNAPFPAKRRIIIGKEQGVTYNIEYTEQGGFKLDTKVCLTPFVPPATRNVFLKYYTVGAAAVAAWTEQDAECYKKSMYRLLHKRFGVTGTIVE